MDLTIPDNEDIMDYERNKFYNRESEMAFYIDGKCYTENNVAYTCYYFLNIIDNLLNLSLKDWI